MDKRYSKTTQDGLKCSLDGKAGEYAVAAQLLKRHIAIAWPAIDTGYDLRAENGCRIQVKTTHQLSTDNKQNYPAGAYWFALAKYTKRKGQGGVLKVVLKPPFSEVCDVVVFVGIDTNQFWILPAKICDDLNALVTGFENPRRFAGDINQLRELNKNGMSHEKIAEMFNCHRVTVTRLINSDKDVQKKSNFQVARDNENAWHHITEFGSTAVEPEVEVEPEPTDLEVQQVLEATQHGMLVE